MQRYLCPQQAIRQNNLLQWPSSTTYIWITPRKRQTHLLRGKQSNKAVFAKPKQRQSIAPTRWLSVYHFALITAYYNRLY